MNNILTTILKDTYSLTQLKHRVRILKAYLLKHLFASTTDSSPSPVDLNWLKSLSADFYHQFNKDNVYQIFTDLEKQITNCPVLTMYLTFEPDEMALPQIGSFARQQFNKPSLILDIKIDPNLITGAALAWKGVYKDYSLRLKIGQRKAEIFQGFKRFLR